MIILFYGNWVAGATLIGWTISITGVWMARSAQRDSRCPIRSRDQVPRRPLSGRTQGDPTQRFRREKRGLGGIQNVYGYPLAEGRESLFELVETRVMIEVQEPVDLGPLQPQAASEIGLFPAG